MEPSNTTHQVSPVKLNAVDVVFLPDLTSV